MRSCLTKLPHNTTQQVVAVVVHVADNDAEDVKNRFWFTQLLNVRLPNLFRV